MSFTADQAWVYRFHDTLLLTFQQMNSIVRSLLDPSMVHNDVSAAIDYHERLGNGIASDVVSPFAPTAAQNINQSRRAVTMQSSDFTVLVSDENNLRSMVNPTNGYTRTILAGCTRRADKHVIDALIGNASTAAVTPGTGIITTSTQAMLAAHQIGAATAIDLARIVNAAELLSKKGVPNDGKRAFLYSPGQLRDILAITQASSSDFTKNQIHDKGSIDNISWEGFRWYEIADVIADDANTILQRMLPVPSFRQCIAFHPDSVGLSIAKEIKSQLDPRPDLQSRPMQVRASMMMAAVRVWEGGVVEVRALEN
jgi:Phage capsid protein